MNAITLTHYPENSPAAMLRVIAMFILSDGEVAEGEMEAVDGLNILGFLGGDRPLFAEVLTRYCDDLIAYAGDHQTVNLVDQVWLDAVFAPITAADKQRLLARALLLIARADGYFADAELVVVKQALTRWNLELDDLAD